MPLRLLALVLADPCADAKGAVERDTCLARASNAAEVEMTRYLGAARKRATADGAAVAKAFDEAQARWLAFRKAECDAVFAHRQGGTARGAILLNCRIDLTRTRTQWLWKTWLTYPDSTPPILPEPGLSADGTS
ncbi:lysozyme inhibitor LprI family protein [Sphingomonas pituitosa]|uniref:lysozyme inhibitor LprI family protein n=1 Tax=Sphingomonas pituitosa TaxID=99597 RepID=UPI000829837B|nr:lysozyme inhibitor LprI family protein [Sphingomonas pituitosa]